jgi:hypothetical protein
MGCHLISKTEKQTRYIHRNQALKHVYYLIKKNAYICYMKRQLQDHSDIFGRVVFIFLLILLLSVFSDISAGQHVNLHRHELTVDTSLSHTAGIEADIISVPVFEKNWISLIDSKHILLNDHILRLRADNMRTEQLISYLQKTLLLIKPVFFCMFYPQIYPEDQGELPSLS